MFQKMPKLSLCMILLNEEKLLGRCLDSVRGVFDEIILVDTGSTDKTKEIARKYTDKIYDFKWIQDFAAARNFSFAQATGDFIMWLDADDFIKPVDRQKLLDQKARLDDSVDTVMCVYDYSFDAMGNPTFSFHRERIVKNCDRAKWEGVVHEVIPMFGKTIETDIAVSHGRVHIANPARNIEIYEKLLKSGKPFSPRDRYYYAKELHDHGRLADAIENFKLFLGTGKGWSEDCIRACNAMADCYRRLGNPDAALATRFDTFKYSVPRPEACCEIGQYFFDKKLFGQAIFWYELALRESLILNKKPIKGWVSKDYHGFIPALQLCLCHDKLGDYKKAAGYNKLAATFKPDHPSIAHNKAYFKNKFDK